MGQSPQWQKIRLPKLPSLTQLYIEKVTDDLEVSGRYLTKEDFQSQQAAAVSIDSSQITDCNFAQTEFPRLIIINSSIEKGDLSNGSWVGSSLKQVAIRNSRLTGLKADQATVVHATLQGCPSSYSQWQASLIKNLHCIDCDLSNAYFNQAALFNTIFDNCNLSDADFSQAKLNHVDLRGSKIDGIKIDVTQAKKLKVTPAQALYLMSQLGVAIDF